MKHLSSTHTEGRRWYLADEDALPIAYVTAADGEYGSVGSRPAKFGDETVVDHEFMWDHGIALHEQKLDASAVALTNAVVYGAWLLLDTEAGKRSSIPIYLELPDFTEIPRLDHTVFTTRRSRPWMLLELSAARKGCGLLWKHCPSKPVSVFGGLGKRSIGLWNRWRRRMTQSVGRHLARSRWAWLQQAQRSVLPASMTKRDMLNLL